MNTYEKKYKDALEKAEEIIRYYKEHNRGDEAAIEDIETIFPELAESEDEGIRKAIIETIEDCSDILSSDNQKRMIAWLEKQGEKPQGKTALEAIHEEKVDNANKVVIESKFKVGDWVANSIETVQITGYDIDYGYQVDYKGNLQHRDTDIIEKEYHLWIIQDAKDGDVLIYNNTSVEIILLFKKWMNGVGNGAYSYAHTFNNKILFNDWSDCGYTTHPATKEQRDLLFQKIHDAGYEWDADKKELRKIEQKSKWGEEDEEMCQETIDWFEKKCFPYALEHENPARECISWLKSLKQRWRNEL